MKIMSLMVLFFVLFTTNVVESAVIYNTDGNQLDLYGKFNGMNYFIHNSRNIDVIDRSSLRYGFKGQTKINNYITGFATWEYESPLRFYETDLGSHTYLGYAGLKVGDHSSIYYGRTYGVLYDVSVFNDVMPAFSSGSSTSIVDNFLTNRANNVLTYRNDNFFGLVKGLNVVIQYQGKNNNKILQKANGDGYGLSMSYSVTQNVTAAAAYTNSKHCNYKMTSTNDSINAEAYSIGIKYDNKQLYLATMYSETSNMTPYVNNEVFSCANNVKNIELLAQYQLYSGIRPSVGYRKSIIRNTSSRVNLMTSLELGASYFLNKNMSTFFDYRIVTNHNTSLKKNGNVLALGLVYTF